MPHPQLGAVGVDGSVHRVDRPEGQQVGPVHTGGLEAAVDEVGHRQHGGARVEAESAAFEGARTASRVVRRFEHRDVVTRAGQVAGGREAPEPRADDHDARHADLRMARSASSVSAARDGAGNPSMAASATA